MAGNSVVFSHQQVVQVGPSTASISGAPVATHLIPVTSFSAEEVVTPIPDNGRRGPHALNFRQPAGVKLVNITIEGVVQADPGTTLGYGIGVFLRNFFGAPDVATSVQAQGAGLWNHDFQLKAGDGNPVIEYLTIETDNQHSVEASNRSFVGCRVQVLSYTATLTGASVVSKAPANLAAQAATIEDAFAGWEVLNAYDDDINYATGPFQKLISAEWTLSRAVSVLYTATNTQTPNQIMLGPIACTVALVMDFDNTAEIQNFRTGKEVKILHVFKRGLESSALTNSASRRFIIGSSNFSIIDQPVTVDISGEHATIAIGARALYNVDASMISPDASVGVNDGSMSASAGPIQIRLMDAKTATYA